MISKLKHNIETKKNTRVVKYIDKWHNIWVLLSLKKSTRVVKIKVNIFDEVDLKDPQFLEQKVQVTYLEPYC